MASAIVAVVAYCGLFTWLGLRVRRALPWGLAYILIWEGFVAAAGAGASRVALRAYTRSMLSEITGQDLRLADMAMPVAVLVPLRRRPVHGVAHRAAAAPHRRRLTAPFVDRRRPAARRFRSAPRPRS